MVCTVCLLLWWKVLARVSWNFKVVQIFLVNQIVLLGTHGLHYLFSFVMEKLCTRLLEFWAPKILLNYWNTDCLNWHAWFALFVFFCDGKFLLKAVGILSLINWMADCFVRHTSFLLSVLFCDGKFLLEAVWIWACPNKLHQLDYFVRYEWFALSIFLCDGNFLLQSVGILSWSKYS